MTGDTADFIARLKSALPTRWFPDSTPVLDTLLTGLATGWTTLYGLLAELRLQARVATATGAFLDGVSADFFAARLPRRVSETDDSYRLRIADAFVRPHATRTALTSAVQGLTGHAPAIFEPARPADTGAYGYAMGYGQAGAWGSLSLPFQVFVVARRPTGTGIAQIAGYGTGGPLARASLVQIAGQVTDAEINATIASVLPTAVTAWTTITN